MTRDEWQRSKDREKQLRRRWRHLIDDLRIELRMRGAERVHFSFGSAGLQVTADGDSRMLNAGTDGNGKACLRPAMIALRYPDYPNTDFG